MKLSDAIAKIDELKPNVYSWDTKVDWLSKLDYMITTDIILTHECAFTHKGANTHEGADNYKDFHGYDPDLDGNTELIAPPPYDSIYPRWLEAQIDLANGEYDRYNASITLYNTEWQAFADSYNRTHMPLSHGRIRF